MAMAFSLAACGNAEIIINDPGCTRKTFPTYFEELAKLRARCLRSGGYDLERSGRYCPVARFGNEFRREGHAGEAAARAGAVRPGAARGEVKA
eukprot:1180430-Prorocentrum_minimum.AAC.2